MATSEGQKWVTCHPHPDEPGRPVLLNSDGTVAGGMGGRFNGQKIGELYKGGGHKDAPTASGGAANVPNTLAHPSHNAHAADYADLGPEMAPTVYGTPTHENGAWRLHLRNQHLVDAAMEGDRQTLSGHHFDLHPDGGVVYHVPGESGPEGYTDAAHSMAIDVGAKVADRMAIAHERTMQAAQKKGYVPDEPDFGDFEWHGAEHPGDDDAAMRDYAAETTAELARHRASSLKDVRDFIRHEGGIAPHTRKAGDKTDPRRSDEYLKLPSHLKNERGLTLDQMAGMIAEKYPGLGIETENDLHDYLTSTERERKGGYSKAALHESTAVPLTEDVAGAPVGVDPDAATDTPGVNDNDEDDRGPLFSPGVIVSWRQGSGQSQGHIKSVHDHGDVPGLDGRARVSASKDAPAARIHLHHGGKPTHPPVYVGHKVAALHKEGEMSDTDMREAALSEAADAPNTTRGDRPREESHDPNAGALPVIGDVVRWSGGMGIVDAIMPDGLLRDVANTPVMGTPNDPALKIALTGDKGTRYYAVKASAVERVQVTGEEAVRRGQGMGGGASRATTMTEGGAVNDVPNDAVDIVVTGKPTQVALVEAYVGRVTRADRLHLDAEVQIISPGFGASRANGLPVYYGATPLREAAPRFSKSKDGKPVKCYFNHPTARERAQRPERDVTKWVASLHESWWDEGRQAVMGKMRIINSDLMRMVEAAPDEVGLSMDSSGKTTPGTVNGQRAAILESIDRIGSVDIVTEAGARGGIVRLLESVGGDGQGDKAFAFTEAEQREVDSFMLSDIKATDLREARADIVKEIEDAAVTRFQEAQGASAATHAATAAQEQVTAFQEALKAQEERTYLLERELNIRDTRALVDVSLQTADIPVPTRERVKASFTEATCGFGEYATYADPDKLTEAVTALVESERAYIASVTEATTAVTTPAKGRVITGMNGGTAPTVTAPAQDRATKFSEAASAINAKMDELLGGPVGGGSSATEGATAASSVAAVAKTAQAKMDQMMGVA